MGAGETATGWWHRAVLKSRPEARKFTRYRPSQGLRRQIAIVRRTHNQPQALLLTGHKVAVGLTAVGEYRLGSAVLLVTHPHRLGNGSAGADRRAMALLDPPLAHWPS
jgi:hypothetical protein